MIVTRDPFAFLDLMIDILRLPDEARATAYIYTHKYRRFVRRPDSGLEKDPLDDHTLVLTALHLTTLTLSSPYPRRLSALILPAWQLLHPSSPPLSNSSSTYTALRATVLRSSLLILRALGFHTTVSTPLQYTSRYLSRSLEELEGPAAAAGLGRYEEDGTGASHGDVDHANARGSTSGARRNETRRGDRGGDDVAGWESYSRADRARLGVGPLSDTGLSKAVIERAMKALRNEDLACLFPARTLAIASVMLGLRDRGIAVEQEEQNGWVRNLSGGKVNIEDFEEVVGLMGGNK